jgi:hypothetical protein
MPNYRLVVVVVMMLLLVLSISSHYIPISDAQSLKINWRAKYNKYEN